MTLTLAVTDDLAQRNVEAVQEAEAVQQAGAVQEAGAVQKVGSVECDAAMETVDHREWLMGQTRDQTELQNSIMQFGVPKDYAHRRAHAKRMRNEEEDSPLPPLLHRQARRDTTTLFEDISM